MRIWPTYYSMRVYPKLIEPDMILARLRRLSTHLARWLRTPYRKTENWAQIRPVASLRESVTIMRQMEIIYDDGQ